MGTTENFNLAFFDFGEDLSDPLSVQKEISRFTTIDRQLFGMASIFGNGIVSGWNIIDAGDLNITISPGVGIVENKAIETFFSETLELTPNSTLNLYALPGANFETDRNMTFSFSNTVDNTGLFIGQIITGGTNIESISTEDRSLIGFKQIVLEEIAKHRHNGTVPKIDLTQEVQGLLPTSRMADIDASKIVGGKLPTSVIPVINHNNLSNKGILTHPQIDSIVNSLQKDNLELIGEIATVNLMKLILLQKYQNPTADRYFINELALIPGISPDSYIDFENSTANINKASNCISGIPELPLDLSTALENVDGDGNARNTFEIINIIWKTDEQFRKESVSIINLTVKDGVKISVDTIADRIIDDFEGVIGNPIGSYTATLNETNSTKVLYESVHAQGDSSAKFEHQNSRTASFVKVLSQSEDWRAYDQLILFIKNTETEHSSVSLKIYDSEDVVLATFNVLNNNEQTVDDDGIVGFAKREIDISSIDRADVKKIELVTNNIEKNSESFLVDTIYLRTNEKVLPQGTIRFRKNTTSAVIFNAIEYSANIPAGCGLRVRARVSSTLEDLVNAVFTSNLQSGEVFALSGNYIEIDITLVSNSVYTLTPILTQLSLQMLAPSQISGIQISSASAWEESEDLVNISINQSSNEADTNISMTNTNVDNFHFINENQVSELDPNNFPFVGLSSQYMPISTVQAYNVIVPPDSTNDPEGVRRKDTRGLYQPKSSYRLDNSNFLIADTGNDRVLELKPDGTFVRGWASHNKDFDETDLYSLTCNYNPRLGVLFITLSRTTDVSNFDLSLIRLIIGGTREIRLSNEEDLVRLSDGTIVTERTPGATDANPPADGTGDVDRLLTVVLSLDKRNILDTTTSNVICSISTDIRDQSECFIGDFMYFGAFGVHRPIYANKTDNRILVCNASILSESTSVIKTFPIIEFEQNIGELVEGSTTPVGLSFSYDKILFSDIMLGSAQVVSIETDDGEIQRKVLVSGVVYNPDINVDISSSSSSLASDVFSVILSEEDNKKMLPFQGFVRLIDMTSSLVVFEYQCSDGLYPTDCFRDKEGKISIAESSFEAQSGRIITLDPNGIGDGKQPPIIRLIEGGLFTKIWDIRELKNNNIFVST